MYKEDILYIIKSMLITVIPVFIITILTDYILSIIFTKPFTISFLDLTIKSIFLAQIIGFLNLFKKDFRKSNIDEFEKINIIRLLALYTLLFVLLSIIFTLLVSIIVNYFLSNDIDLYNLSSKILVNTIIIALMSIYKLKLNRDKLL